jgi:hypothetical protein
MSNVRQQLATSVPREWQTLRYLDPRHILLGLRQIALTQPLDQLEYKVASLRTRELRGVSEGRQAAIFSYGIGQLLGAPIAFAQSESRDYDVVVRYVANGHVNYVPVQLKEWVPEFLNSHADLQSELDKLDKYVDSHDLAVAFHLNRNATIHLSELKLPRTIGELWFYGATDPSQNTWTVIGNLLRPDARVCEFAYPDA